MGKGRAERGQLLPTKSQIAGQDHDGCYTGKSRGFGFVEMANAEDGEKAITALNGTLLDERALNVNEARPKKEPASFRDRDSRNRSGGGRRW